MDEPLRATLGFLEKLTLRPDELRAQDAEDVLAAGVREDALIDAIHIAALFTMIVRLADSFGWHVPLDRELAARAEARLGSSYALLTPSDVELVKLEDAQAIVDFVVREASGPVSVFVANTHGELVAAATMDGAAPDTRLNAQRKAYTAARSDARSTRELAEKVREDAVERESFDPFFTFFLGGVAAFDGETRVGAVGVSGLPGEVDEALAQKALEAAGLSF